LAWTLIGAGVAVVQPSLIGLLLILQPALAFVWDILIFNRNTPPLEVVGVVLVIGGIYLGARQGKNVRLARPALARRKED
jgi:drug/metabolite transporter (DMT)-like permease